MAHATCSHAAPTAEAGRCVGIIWEARVREEIIERLLDDFLQVIIVGTRLVAAIRTRLQRQRRAVLVRQSELVDVGCIGRGELVRNRLFLLAEVRPRVPHHPLIGLIRGIERGDRAPCLRAENRVTDTLDRADRRQIIIIERRITGHAQQCRLCATTRHAEAEDPLRVPRKVPCRVTKVADRRLQIRHTGRRARITTTAARVHIYEARVRILGHARVLRHRRLWHIPRRIDRHHDRCRRRCVPADLRRRIDRAGKGPIAIGRRLHVRARHDDRELLVIRVRRRRAVGDPQLIVDVVRLVIAPLRVVDLRQRALHSRLFRSRRQCLHLCSVLFVRGCRRRTAAQKQAGRNTDGDHSVHSSHIVLLYKRQNEFPHQVQCTTAERTQALSRRRSPQDDPAPGQTQTSHSRNPAHDGIT